MYTYICMYTYNVHMYMGRPGGRGCSHFLYQDNELKLVTLLLSSPDRGVCILLNM